MASIHCLSSSLQLGSLAARTSELTGAGAEALSTASVSVASSNGPLLVQPIAGRKCDLTGKKANNGYRVSFSNHRTKHLQGVNLQYKRLWWEERKCFVKMRISTNALKTIDKKGLSQMAKEAGIDLLDYVV